MNWNRTEEAILTACVNYVYWCSDINRVRATGPEHISE